MKTLIIALVLIPALAMSQTKTDNTIVIKNISSDQAVNVFRDHGYMIGAATPSVVSTVQKKSDNGIPIVIQIDIKDSVGYLHGTYDGKRIVPGLWQHTESWGGKYKGGSFKILDSLAHAFGKPVEYAQIN